MKYACSGLDILQRICMKEGRVDGKKFIVLTVDYNLVRLHAYMSYTLRWILNTRAWNRGPDFGGKLSRI